MNDLQQRVADLVVQEHFADDDVRQLGPEAVPMLIATFQEAAGALRDRKCSIALHALGILATDAAVQFLIATAENPEVEGWLRRAAVRSLGHAAHAQTLEYLASLLEHPNFSMRDNAVMALRHAATPRALQLLAHVHTADPDERIRRRAAQALGHTQESGERDTRSGRRIIGN
jgi:HEAT repeat protein